MILDKIENRQKNYGKDCKKGLLFLIVIVIIGGSLRLYQIGIDSFWIDEVGVAIASRKASFGEMIQESRSHIMAMPLDYCLSWFIARISIEEGIFRSLSAFWGTLSLIINYLFFKRLSNRGTALLSTLLFALSPFHIQYSQELRFYSSLVFFYLLVNWLFLKAIEEVNLKNWLLATIATIIGIFFHVYVILSLINFALWIWLQNIHSTNKEKVKTNFSRSLIIILIAFLSAIILFGGVSKEPIPILLYEDSFIDTIGVGMGWINFYNTEIFLNFFWGHFCLAFCIIGILSIKINKEKNKNFVLLLSIIIQIIIIIFMNYLKHYFIAPRQFLIFLPFGLYFSSIGIQTCIRQIKYVLSRLWKSKSDNSNNLLINFLLYMVIILISIPALATYYHGDKGQAEKIIKILSESLHPGELILIIPDYEVQLFNYYTRELEINKLSKSIFAASWNNVCNVDNNNFNQYLVTNIPITYEQSKLLKSCGFIQIYLPTNISRYSHSIWIKRD